MAMLDGLLDKYNLRVSEAEAVAGHVSISSHVRPLVAISNGAIDVPGSNIVSVQYNGSVTKASVVESEKMIRKAGKPIPLGDLFDRLAAKGIRFQSKEPKSTLSAVLGQSGKLASYKGLGWWLKDEPLPKPSMSDILS